MGTVEVSIHDSQWPSRWRRALGACLRNRTVDARFHYESPAQTAAWLALHESHSPARLDPAVAKIYPDAVSRCLARGPRPARLASLGCGGGQKDIEALRASGASAYAAIDASPGMVIEALDRVRAALPAVTARGLVADLHATGDIASWLGETLPRHEPTLWLGFGIVPNLPAPEIPHLLGSLLRHADDALLLGANLIPGRDPEAEMAAILPQYDNQPTRRWLALLPGSLGIPAAPADLQFSLLAPDNGRPWRVAVELPIRLDCRVPLPGESITLAAGESLTLFVSNRFTPDDIASLAEMAGLRIAASMIAPSKEEGVFEIRSAGPPTAFGLRRPDSPR